MRCLQADPLHGDVACADVFRAKSQQDGEDVIGGGAPKTDRDQFVGDMAKVVPERLPQPIGLLHLHLAAPLDRFANDILLLRVGIDLRREPFELARLERDELVRLLEGLLEQHELCRIATAVGVHRHRLGEIRLLDVLCGDGRKQSENRQALWVVWGCWRRAARRRRRGDGHL